MIVAGSLQTAQFPKISKILGNNLKPGENPWTTKLVFKRDRYWLDSGAGTVKWSMATDCEVLQLEDLIWFRKHIYLKNRNIFKKKTKTREMK